MGLFEFVKDAGEKLAADAAGLAGSIMGAMKGHDLPVDDLEVEQDGDKVVLRGKAPDQATLEKAILAAGNVSGVAAVETQVDVASAAEASAMYIVKSGDTLSGIAKAHYGDAMKYPAIFEANRPMLSDPNKIYPGQVLRLPADV